MAPELSHYENIELQALRRSTLDLIGSRPQRIKLRRKGKYQRTPEGGMKRGNDIPYNDLPEVARYFGGVQGTPMVIEDQKGQTITASYVLVGKHGEDIQKYDEFDLNGTTYMVVAVDPASLSWQTKAWVTEKGIRG